MPAIIFGTVVEMKHMSAKDRLERKKYMGVWRWESKLTIRIMSRFPSKVTRYMDRNTPNRMRWKSGSSESPRRWNSEIYVRFFASSLALCWI
jgi:hypothetical protein